jgi:hypothetical protein
MSMQMKKTVLDGAGADAVSDMLFLNNFPATVVVLVQAGSTVVEYSCNSAAEIKAGAELLVWIPWDFGAVTSAAPGVHTFVGPITALRMTPVGGDAIMNVVAKAP